MTCSLLRPSRPSTRVSTSLSVASLPVGAPLAISTEGAEERSERAPATPSSTQRQVSSRGDGISAGGDDQRVKGAWGGLFWRRCLIVQAAKGGRRADDRSTHGHRDILVYRHRGLHQAVGEKRSGNAESPRSPRRAAAGRHRGSRRLRLQDGGGRLLRRLWHRQQRPRGGARG